MNIWMMTNTYTPFVGGVARSVAVFTRECRKAGHRVLVVAPVYEGAPQSEPDVVRVPAIQNFNGSDFSVALPAPGYLGRAAFETAREFSMDRCVRDLLTVYERLVERQAVSPKDDSVWRQTMEEVKGEWELLRNVAGAVGHAIAK